MQSLDVAAAHAGLSVASFARLALELLVDRNSVTLEDVRAEAQRLTVGDGKTTLESVQDEPARSKRK